MQQREKKVPISALIDPDIVEFINEFNSATQAPKAVIINQCMKYGLEIYKQKNPSIIKLIEENREPKIDISEKKRVSSPR